MPIFVLFLALGSDLLADIPAPLTPYLEIVGLAVGIGAIIASCFL